MVVASVQNKEQGEQEQCAKVSWKHLWLIKQAEDITYSGIQLH